MVHFTQYRLRILFYSDIRMTRSHAPDYSIRSSAGQRICAPLRGFSQLITTFIALQLHRHPPWTYISLDHIIFSIPAYLFSATSVSGFFYLCQAFRPLSLAIRGFVSYLHSSLSGFTLQELMFLPFTFTVKELSATFFSKTLPLWNRIELNYRPPPYQSGALTNWATVQNPS